MKKSMKIISLLLGALTAAFAAACGGGGTDESVSTGGASVDSGSGGGSEVREQKIEPLSFEGIGETQDLKKFILEVDNGDGTHDNTAKTEGAIVSPYFELETEGKETPCYAVRTSLGAHSFAMVDAGADSFPLRVTVNLLYGAERLEVLPAKYGVKAELTPLGAAAAEIPGFGNYTFVADDRKETALTLVVRETEEFRAPEGYEVMRVPAGTHAEKLEFTAEKQIMVFEKGTHYLKYNVEFKNNTEVYLEEGCYIYATMPDRKEKPMLDPAWSGMVRWQALFHGANVGNVKLSGRGMIDLTKLDWHARSAVHFENSENVEVTGITLNNSPEWTLYFLYSQNIVVRDVLLFGYRQNSDGICFGDCRNALAENCFARSGDDLFEVKSMNGGCTIPIENIRFRRCNGWPDKARGMGIVYESVRDMRDVRFENCSIGFASATWQDELGALVVVLGGKATVKDVHFEDIEIHASALYPINVTVCAEASARIEEVYFRNIDIWGAQSVRVANNSAAGGEIGKLYFDGCTRDGAAIRTYAKLGLKLTNVEKTAVLINRKDAK